MTCTLYVGVAVGPALSSVLIRSTGNPLVPFYVILSIHVLQSLFIWLIIPESLSKTRQIEAKKVQKERREEKRQLLSQEARESERAGFKRGRTLWIRMKAISRPVTTIFEPLRLLGPRKQGNGHFDWSLPMLAAACGFYDMLTASPLLNGISRHFR